MNLKTIILSIASILVLLSVTGCSSHSVGKPYDITMIESHPEYQQKLTNDVYLIATHNDSSKSISRASDIEESAYFTLQRAAEVTLARGDKYFAVNAPQAMSNLNGSTINTMEDFIEKCGTSAGGSMGSMFDAFGANNYYCNISGVKIVHYGYIEVAFFKEQPDHVLVWDAQAVIDYLKKEDLYKEYDINEVKVIPSVAMPGLPYWLKNYRNAKQ